MQNNNSNNNGDDQQQLLRVKLCRVCGATASGFNDSGNLSCESCKSCSSTETAANARFGQPLVRELSFQLFLQFFLC